MAKVDPRVRLLLCGFPAAIIDGWNVKHQKMCAVRVPNVMDQVTRPWGATFSRARNVMGRGLEKEKKNQMLEY